MLRWSAELGLAVSLGSVVGLQLDFGFAFSFELSVGLACPLSLPRALFSATWTGLKFFSLLSGATLEAHTHLFDDGVRLLS